MKLIVAGSRDLDEELVYAELVKLRIQNHDIVQATEIVSGCAKGADTAGEMYGDFYDIPVKKFPAKWGSLGKRAGLIRNEEMGEYADCAIVFMKMGGSRGSQHMIDTMKKLGKPVFIFDEIEGD